MVQPGVYFTLEAPFVRILGIYSNMLENPGVISSTKDPKTGKPKFPTLTEVQLTYVDTALSRVKSENYDGALLIAVHHPPYAFGKHSGSTVMLKEIDAICDKRGVWPHECFRDMPTTISATQGTSEIGRSLTWCAATGAMD